MLAIERGGEKLSQSGFAFVEDDEEERMTVLICAYCTGSVH